MKSLMMLLSLLLILASCGTSSLQKQVLEQQELYEETIKEDRMIGGDLPSWVRKSGIEHGVVYVVGKAEFSANKSPFYVEKAAMMDADMALFADAPTDIRIITQNALVGAGIDSSEFYQIQTKLQEVVGVTGIRHDEKKVVCRKFIRYGELSTRKTRACWAQAAISVSQLMKAYQRTLALKFGEYKANEFKDLMNEELKKVNNNPLTRRRRNETSSQTNTRNSNTGTNDGDSSRLSTKQIEETKKRFQVPSKNGKRKNLSRSRKES